MQYILEINPVKPDISLIRQVADLLCRGGVIAYPTETFYGIGCDATNEEAVEKVYTLKGRAFSSPLPVIVGGLEVAAAIVQKIPKSGKTLIGEFWPGPLTIICQAADRIPRRLTAATGKIGLRVSSHPVANEIAKALNRPLTATSANLSGSRECTSAPEVISLFGRHLDLIVDAGKTAGGRGSTIVDVTIDPPNIIREGAIPLRDIERVLGEN